MLNCFLACMRMSFVDMRSREDVLYVSMISPFPVLTVIKIPPEIVYVKTPQRPLAKR